MTYELAERLKHAGFPQGAGTYTRNPKYKGKTLKDIDDNTYAFTPSLSELIEACGDRFKMLVRHDSVSHQVGHWQAIGDNQDRWNKTPEEAVANLWLALNT